MALLVAAIEQDALAVRGLAEQLAPSMACFSRRRSSGRAMGASVCNRPALPLSDSVEVAAAPAGPPSWPGRSRKLARECAPLWSPAASAPAGETAGAPAAGREAGLLSQEAR